MPWRTGPTTTAPLQLQTIEEIGKKMNKVLYIILISLFSLTIISCVKKDDSLSSSSSDDSSSGSGSTDNSDSDSGSSATLKISPFVINTTLSGGTIKGSV